MGEEPARGDGAGQSAVREAPLVGVRSALGYSAGMIPGSFQ